MSPSLMFEGIALSRPHYSRIRMVLFKTSRFPTGKFKRKLFLRLNLAFDVDAYVKRKFSTSNIRLTDLVSPSNVLFECCFSTCTYSLLIIFKSKRLFKKDSFTDWLQIFKTSVYLFVPILMVVFPEIPFIQDAVYQGSHGVDFYCVFKNMVYDIYLKKQRKQSRFSRCHIQSKNNYIKQ